MIKIAIIEAGDFHDECLHSQIQFLKRDDIEVTLFCNSKLKERINDLPDVKEIVYLDLSGKIKKYKSWYQTWRHIVKNRFSKVIFNSAESNIYKLIRFPFPKSIELIGVIHNAHNLQNKPKQKFISKRLHKYLTLNDFVTENIQKEKLTHLKVNSFYPIFFPSFESSLIKPSEKIWITVPGVIDLNKRDYRSFKDLKIPKEVKIIFLGRASTSEGKQFIEDARSYPSADQFVFFNSFIPNALFYDYIKQSDYILPLIHPGNDFFERFLKYKITGTYNLAFGYKKTLLVERSFSEIEDFKENAIFYDHNNMQEIFQKIKNPKKNTYQHPKWDFDIQKENYLNFILH